MNGDTRNRFARHVRTTLLFVVVAAACYVSYGLGKLWAEWRQAARPVTEVVATTSERSSTAMSMPLAGQWSFAELDWNLRSSLVPPSEVDQRLDSLVAAAASAEISDLPEMDDDLMELAAVLRLEPIERAGSQIYVLNRPGMKGRLVVRKVDGGSKVAGFVAAYPLDTDQWQVLEGTPRGFTKSADTATPHLLPLPPNSQRNGGRFGADGGLVMEFVSVRCDAAALLAKWKQAGWEVRASEMGSSDGFSYLCARGREVVYAWSPDPLGALENLMLVRTPGPSDTKP